MARITQKEIHGVMTDVIEMDAPADELEDALRAQIAAEQAIESAETAQDAAERAEEAALRAEENIAGVSSFNGRYGAVKPQAGDYTAEDVGAASSADHLVKTYTYLAQVGLSVGSETIESIAAALPTFGELRLTVGSQYNTSIYPVSYGSLKIAKYGSDSSLVIFEFVQKSTNRAWLGVYDSTAVTPWYGWVETANPAGFLPLSGGTLSGELALQTRIKLNSGGKNRASIENWGTGETILRSIADDNSGRYLALKEKTLTENAAQCLQLVEFVEDGSWVNGYYLYGEHNKPLGSYTGNGSATSRTIDTGGIGNVLLIHCIHGTALVTSSGAFLNTGGGTLTGLNYEQVHFTDGVLTLATTNSILNANGITIYYQVL